MDAWPRDTLDTIHLKFEETKLRVGRGSDPVGRKQAAAKMMQIEQAQLEGSGNWPSAGARAPNNSSR
ncbi:hypothetical protein [Paraburkholderia sp. J41]|uniref:hypothetical protein n=1 Tax=Paraburkholderia sp. J41 TaxID=2805433 RepID=UPI002AC31E30|nr:hypothetical protein [Paraburkholderia sp. J41]